MEGALVSSSGDFMQNIAQSWLVWHLSQSPVAIGVIAVFDTVPRLLIGAVGGAIADRFDRRRVLMITQSLAMLQAFAYWLLVEFEGIELWHIALLSFFLGVVNTINQTARQSLVNSLVPREELLNAIGLQSSVFNFSKIMGPSVGGLIIAYIGIAGCFLINALSFVYLIFNLYQMELPPWEARQHKQGLLGDIKEGFFYLRANRRMLGIVGISYVMALFGAPYNRFVPMFATNVLHVGAAGFGMLMSAPGIGAMVASLSLATVNKLRVGTRVDLFLRARIRAVSGTVRFLLFVHFVDPVSRHDRFLPGRRARVDQYGHSNRNAAGVIRASLELVLHGPRLVVSWRFAYRHLGVGHRHRLDLRGLRRCLRHRRDRFVDLQPQAAHRSSSTLSRARVLPPVAGEKK